MRKNRLRLPEDIHGGCQGLLNGEPFGSWVKHISQPIAEQVDEQQHPH
ncbi:hypothetical protein [Candidatus Entotheonella palauensis]|nr:hypothetical protein [Candidatus Entotheonella palauensis]